MKLSAPSSFRICLISPVHSITTVSDVIDVNYGLWRTEYDLAAVQNADQLVSRGLVMVDLQQL